MSLWMWIVIGVIAAAFYNLGRKRGHEDAKLVDKPSEETQAAPSQLRDDHQDSEIEQLRERVRVLERIAVDGRSAKSIADEIESLRDAD